MRIDKIAIIGVGLIGGSIALGLKRRLDHKVTILGSCSSPERTLLTQKENIIDIPLERVENIPSDCKLVVIATPIHSVLPTIKKIEPHLFAETLIIDVSSTKEIICRKTRTLLPKNIFFLGTHPMAGSEFEGYENAKADLFVNKPWIICPTNNSQSYHVNLIKRLILILGGEPIEMSPPEHDQLVASASHLPILASSLLFETVSKNKNWSIIKTIASTGLQDVTRLASDNTTMKMGIIETNKGNVIVSLKQLKSSIEHFIADINQNKLCNVKNNLSLIKLRRDEWIKEKLTHDQNNICITGKNLLSNLHKIEIINNSEIDKYILLSDKNVFEIYGKKIINSLNKLNKPVATIILKSGEQEKNFANILQIVVNIINQGVTRKSLLIALGGGVITDIGGFIASIVLRGINHINIPTTLLGQIDAAIGGKTGVNLWTDKNIMYKNMIGTFKQPLLVISDVDTLASLPKEEIKNGLGEMVKYWIGWGKPSKVQISNIKNQKYLSETISTCQLIKKGIIAKDPVETKGIRQKLNLGHTIGHAIEGTINGKLSHGESVSLGLVAAAKISRKLGLLDKKIEQEVISTIKSLNLPINISGIDREKVSEALNYDKKIGKFVLIKNIGEIQPNMNVDKTVINKVLREIIL